MSSRRASRKTRSRCGARSRCAARRSPTRSRPGHLTIRNDKGEPTASMFYVAYTDPVGRTAAAGHLPVQRRPRLLDHVAAHGLVRADEGRCVACPRRSPARRSAMARTRTRLLDISDLVFIDAPTTGLSRALGKAETKDFFGVDKDIDAFTRTIQRYLTKYQRWNSPKFIIGESYGTTRAAGLVQFAAQRRRPAQRHHLRLDGLQLRRFPGRPVADQLPADLCGRRLVPRQDRRQAAARGIPPAGPRLRQRPLCAGAAEGERDLSAEEKQSVAAADGAADRPFAPIISSRSNLRVDPSRFRARAAARPPPDHRPDRFALSRHRARHWSAKAPITTRRAARSPAPSSARSTTICSATSATRRR